MTSTSGSIFLGESQFISKSLYFNGANYSYWKTRMILFIQANDLAVWDIIMDDPSIPLKQKEELLVPKSKKEWNKEDRRSIQLNAKVMHTLFCALGPDEYNKVSSCLNVKEICDKLEPVTSIEEEKNLEKLNLDEIISSLLTHEMRLNEGVEEAKIEKKKKEGLKLESTKRNDPIICYECKKAGHIKFGYLKWKKKGSSKQKLKAHVTTWSDEDSSDNEDQEVANLFLMALDNPKEEEYCFKVDNSSKNSWYLDNGCSKHMTNDKSYFINLKSTVKEKLLLVTNPNDK
ncbi:hypothetical protein EPI10_002194 [Gossypium australe]|uniref:Retrovirus-related Pol polyprotein from transposon TNT 1-94-like beta-barrel domain-containing protein n=1 Tax=Gossypium australe TaxID=47621 RepID=A0A5B6VD74_9ROSI|nr:hypothetical protein EPI10_002194 [Gossypium australe]